jgi:cytosine/adenosine deaminase-related metal-dependent hydrolase
LTEAYLGDGLFAAAEFARAGGRLAVGSDSNVRIDAVEELRWLEYGQRLLTNSRAQLADGSGLGAPLWRRACEGGAAALAQAVGRIEPGAWADLVSLDPGESVLQGPGEPDAVLDALVTAGDSRCIDAVWVGGRRIEHGRSPAFGATARRLMARPAAAS